MLIFVIVFNLFLTLFNLYIAFRLWRLRRVLARVAKTLTMVERRLHRIFYPAPEVVLRGKQGTHELRQRYQRLLVQIELIEKIFSLVSLGIGIWRRQMRGKRRLRSEKLFPAV
jgi:hypothetical protein